MSSCVRWSDIRAEHVERAGGEEAVAAGKQQLLAEVLGHRLAEIRKQRGLTQQEVADRMGVTKGECPRSNRCRSPSRSTPRPDAPLSVAAASGSSRSIRAATRVGCR
jgi:hypothetical protein